MTAPAETGSTTRPPFWLIIGITLTGIMGNILLGPALPDVADHFGLPLSQVGLLVSATSAPGILLAPVIGLLADRYGRREVLIPCLLVFGLAGGLASFAPTYPVLLGLRLLQGFGSAGLINLAVVLISDHWEGVERTRRIGQNAAALTASLCVIPPLGGLLSDLGGWRATFVPYWIAIVTAIGVRLTLGRGERHPNSLAAQVRATTPHLRNRVIAGVFAMGFVMFALIFGMYLTALPVYLDRDFGVGPAARGLILGIPAVTSVAGALSLGRASQRVSASPLLAGAIACFAASYLLIGLTDSMVVVAIGLLVYGLGEGFCIPVLQNLVSEAAPAATRGAIMAAFVGVGRAGQTAGPVLAGSSLAAYGARTTFLAAAVAAGAAIVLQAVLLRSTTTDRDAALFAPTVE